MSVGGSQQLRLFRRAIRDGATLEDACAATGNIIEPAEGRIYLDRDAKNPPPPEACELLYDPDALAAASQQKEPAMTAAARQEPQNGAEYKKPDAAKAIRIYDEQIRPKLTQINTLKGDLSDPWGDLKKFAHVSKKDFGYVQGLVEEEDDAKRDHRLLSLFELLKARKIELPRDLVTMAEGKDGGSVVPIGERKRPQLATLAGDPNLQMGQPSDGSETDLAEAGEDGDESLLGDPISPETIAAATAGADFEEASPEELAAQEGRPDRGENDDEEQLDAAE